MKGRKFFPKKRGARKATKGYKKRPAKVSDKHIAKVCKGVIARQLENKILNFTFNGLVNVIPYNTTTWPTNCLFPLSAYTSFLQCAQSATQNGRSGNEIMIKKGTIKLLFEQKPYDSSTNNAPKPMFIKIVTFYDKESTTTLVSNLNGFYQNGSSQSDPDITSNIDLLRSYNKDRYVIKSSKILKIGWNIYNTIAGGQSSNQFHANNDFPMTQSFSMDYTKHLVKRVKFQDNSTKPTTRGLFMAIFVFAADGSAIAANQLPLGFRGFMEMQYEDA